MIFQFHKGTIRTFAVLRGYLAIRHFNSIKVRLERKKTIGSWSPLVLFQFHKGTIRTIDAQGKRFRSLEFQFHKGTIRTPLSYQSIMI